jgi:hypothetical protein
VKRLLAFSYTFETNSFKPIKAFKLSTLSTYIYTSKVLMLSKVHKLIELDVTTNFKKKWHASCVIVS